MECAAWRNPKRANTGIINLNFDEEPMQLCKFSSQVGTKMGTVEIWRKKDRGVSH